MFRVKYLYSIIDEIITPEILGGEGGGRFKEGDGESCARGLYHIHALRRKLDG